MNTLAQAEVRRNRLKNDTTRRSPSPDLLIAVVGINGYWPVIPLLSSTEDHVHVNQRTLGDINRTDLALEDLIS